MNHPKSGQTCHADKTEQNHEGGKALHTMELQNYNHDNDSKQEENPMALRADLLKTDLRIVEGQDESTLNKIFEKAAERAINLMTLDERIESFRRWPFAGAQEDFKDLLKMQYERDTEDYRNPGTWYGVIRKWQAMTEEEALAAFRTDWNGSYSYNQYTQEELKALYDFVKNRPMPPLSEQEKLDYYNRRIEPACLKKLFKEMSEANLTHIFEDTYDYNHSAVWEVCEDDFQPFRNSEIRPDVLESLLSASSDILNQMSHNNVIPFRPTTKRPEPRGIERLKAKRRGFVTLAWDGDYDLFTGLQAMDWGEFCEVAQTQGIQVNEVLRSFYNKIQAWQPPNRPICREPDECPVTPEQTELYRSFTNAEGFCHDKFVHLFCNLPNIQETAPISDLKALTDCLEWLCDEDLLQLKAAIDGKVQAITQTVPPEEGFVVDENEPLNIRIAKAISHPKHYQRRYVHLKTLGQENTEYGVWLKNLVAEYYHQDYSQPATEWGVIQRMMAMTLDQFATELELLQDKWGVSLAIKREDSDIDGLHQAVLDAGFTDEQREEFYLESGLNGHLKDFISNLPDSMQCLFEDYRDAIAPDWADLSHPGAAGDDGLKSVISELLELPMDLLMLLAQELPKHQLKSEELLPNTEPINHELLEELRAMDPEERAQTMAYIKQMED